MGVFDEEDDDDYLSPLFEVDWKDIRRVIRQEKIDNIYGNFGKSTEINKDSST